VGAKKFVMSLKPGRNGYKILKHITAHEESSLSMRYTYQFSDRPGDGEVSSSSDLKITSNRSSQFDFPVLNAKRG